MTFGFEGAWVLGPFSVQGEWMQQTVNRDVGDEPDLTGFYVYGSWFLTGESRSYKGGKFGRTKATNAWELAARYSYLAGGAGGAEGAGGADSAGKSRAGTGEAAAPFWE